MIEEEIKLLKDRLTQRLDNDSEEIKAKYMAKSKEDIYNDSFKLAIYETFEDFLSYVVDNLEEDEDFLTDEQKEQFNSLLAQDKNILEFLTNCYWNLRHPEYFNIFYSYDDCFTILYDAVKQKEDMQDNGVYYKVGLELLDKETKRPIEHIEYEEENIRENALDFYNSLETTEDTAKYIYECTEDDEELLDCQGYKDETIGSTSYRIKNKGE